MGRGRQSVRLWNSAGLSPITGAAGGWLDLGGTAPGAAMGRGTAQAHPRGGPMELTQGADRQRMVCLPPVCSAAELVRGQSLLPFGEWSAARNKFDCIQVLLVNETPL